MSAKLELELYTRPTWSDCQDAKKYLAARNIVYVNKDVGADSTLEKEMKQISGNRVVPLFVFYKKGLFGKRKQVKHFTGFQENKSEIVALLPSSTEKWKD